MDTPNILLIYADQWRHDQFGSSKSYTPTLDALAAEGVSFERHYTQIIPCAPSRASLFTGLYAQTHRVVGNGVPLDARHTTIGHYLRDQGYDPTLFGYTDTTLDPRSPAQGGERSGYQVLPGLSTGCHQPDDDPAAWLEHLRAKGLAVDTVAEAYAPDLSKPNATGGAGGHPARYAAQDSDTAFLTDQLASWIDGRAPGWCAMLCYLRPHNPTIAPEPYNSLVDPASLAAPIRAGTPDEEAAIHPLMAHQIIEGQAGVKCSPGLKGRVADVAEKDWRSLRAIHLGLMAEIDANLGRLFDQLKASGQWDNTLILFSSDHGEAMFDHYLCNQAAWTEQCARVPLIVRDPRPAADAARGTVCEAFSEAVDTIPTLLDWLGADRPEHLDGASLVPFLEGRMPQHWRDHVTWEFHYRASVPHGSRMVPPHDTQMTVYRDAAYKHVHFPGLPPLLFDMANDPYELTNLAADPINARIERDYLNRQLCKRLRHDDRTFSPYR